MRLKFCLAFLCCLAAVVIVQSETRIEVDENGDEYEVKRFNIEGRQLNGGRSQCVETRRKRSTASPPQEEAANISNDNNDKNNTNNSNSSSNRNGGEQLITTETTPSTNIDTNTQIDGDYYDGQDEGEGNISLPVNDGQMENDYGVDSEDDYDYENEDIAQNAGENLSPNSIVVVESNQPPKVNPQTHAVFQLLPVNEPVSHAIHADVNHEEEDGNLHYEEEISPVSTTAIWSTGADDGNSLNDLYDEYDFDKEDTDDVKPTKKPLRKPAKKPVKKPSKKPSKKPNKGGNKNKRPKNKRKRVNKKPIQKRRRPGQKNKRPLKGNRRGNKKNKKPVRRPNRPNKRRGGGNSNHHKNSNTNHNIANSNRNKNNRFNKNSNRRFNANLSNRDVKRRKQKNDFVKDKGSKTFTKTETVTHTGTANDEKEVNCIIIRKDPPPTTARPFWNILGRNADSNGRSAHFGNRKRINLRLVPKQE